MTNLPVTWDDVIQGYDYLEIIIIKTSKDKSPAIYRTDTFCHECSLDQTVVLNALHPWKEKTREVFFYAIPPSQAVKALEAIINLADASTDSFPKSCDLDSLRGLMPFAAQHNASIFVFPK